MSKLLFALAYYWKEVMVVPMGGHVNSESKYFKGLLEIAERLKNEMQDHIDAIETSINDTNFQKLKQIVSELIKNNKPEEAIDRLHTYMMMYLRKLLTKHNVSWNQKHAITFFIWRLQKCLDAITYD